MNNRFFFMLTLLISSVGFAAEQEFFLKSIMQDDAEQASSARKVRFADDPVTEIHEIRSRSIPEVEDNDTDEGLNKAYRAIVNEQRLRQQRKKNRSCSNWPVSKGRKVMALAAIIAISAGGIISDTIAKDNSFTPVIRQAFPAFQETYSHGFECDRVQIDCTDQDRQLFNRSCHHTDHPRLTSYNPDDSSYMQEAPVTALGNVVCRSSEHYEKGPDGNYYIAGNGTNCEYKIENPPKNCKEACRLVPNARDCIEYAIKSGAVDFQECTGGRGDHLGQPIVKDVSALITNYASIVYRVGTISLASLLLFFECTQ